MSAPDFERTQQDLDGLAFLFRNLSQERARVLAFDLVRLLLVTFTPSASMPLFREHGTYREMMHAVNVVYTDALNSRCETDYVTAADWLACRVHSHGAGRSWPFEYRIAYDCAEALRRACEHDVLGVLPLIVREAMRCLVDARAEPERVTAMVQEALKGGVE